MLEDKPTVDTSWNLKWKTSFEDWQAKLHYLVRTQKKPTQDQLYAMSKMKECWIYWNSDTALWEKHNMTISIPTSPSEVPEEQGGN